MIASLLFALAQAAAADPAPLGAIGKQALPAKGCAAYLWSLSDRRLVAMTVADPATLRIALDGKVVDYARTAQSGAGGYGFAASTEYRGGDVTAVLDLTVETRADLAAGAAVPQAVLRIERPGRDTLVAPVAGLIGCAG